jgi:hypothetical protein
VILHPLCSLFRGVLQWTIKTTKNVYIWFSGLKRDICQVLKRNNPYIIWWDSNSGKKNVPPPKKLNGHSLLSILEYEVGHMSLYDYNNCLFLNPVCIYYVWCTVFSDYFRNKCCLNYMIIRKEKVNYFNFICVTFFSDVLSI